ncbi:F0F1 ATP synthase subunit delta [Gammaproteobacteria bacterium]|jgi:F-type H+-transporting ATPase subunit delta|nr:F0F1 ATP synthase subunit delta [Gammaproteobacteria bacterium]MDC3302292.1 F0F1 ATP synthase subunit delta [Gammaproteobacteria bacterium]
MIELTPLARPYAKAVFDTAIDLGKSDQVLNELKIMAQASKEKGLIKTIENPALSKEEVEKILISIFEESISETLKKLLSILNENNRLNLINPIYIMYKGLLENHKNQKSVQVTVAVDPSLDTEEMIKSKIQTTYGKDAIITFSKDPEIMGGLSIKIGDETLDLSIKGKISKLINQLNF